MTLSVTLGIIGLAAESISLVLYYRSIFKGETKPHLFTFLIWAIVSSIGFLGQVVSNAGPSMWITGLSTAGIIGVIPLCYWFGSRDITRFDAYCLAGALFAIVPWILTHHPYWSVIFACIIDLIAVLPTLRKTWHAPESESLISWVFAVIKLSCSVGALTVFTVPTALYPITALSADMMILGTILIRRKKNH